MKLFVLRHGETEENIDKIMQGKMDTILNDIGRKQCEKVKNKAKKAQIDLIVSSPLKRTIETAKIAAPGVEIIIDDRLISRNHGEFQGKKRTDINLYDYWNIKQNNKYKEAESVMELYNRVISLIIDLKKEHSKQHILLVTHSGICRILYYYFNGIDPSGDLTDYESTNCSFEEYEII